MPEVSGTKLVNLEDLKVVYDAKLDKSSVVNGLNSTSTESPLSAAQGKALNDNKLNKSGDTMTGSLTAHGFLVKAETYQFYDMLDENGTATGHMRAEKDGNSNNRIVFRANSASANVEDFRLPVADGNANVGYEILTSKTPVTIPQGGHGATTADGACANIGAVKKSGDTMTGTLNVPELHASYNNVDKVKIFADNEGGNILIVSPDGHEYQIDAADGDHLRLFAFDDNNNYHNLTWYRADGRLYAEVLNVGDAQSTRTNLSVYSKAETDSAIANKAFGGYIDASTWSELWTNCLSIITQSQIGFVGIFSDSAASVLSNGKITSLVSATIWRGGSDSSRTFRVMAMSSNGQYQYSWQISSATSSSRTTGTIYTLNGTSASNARTAALFMFSSTDYNTWEKLFNGISSAVQYHTNNVYLGPTAANILTNGKTDANTALWGTFIRSSSTAAAFILTTSSGDTMYKVELSSMNSTSRTTTVRKVTMTTM